MIFKLTTGGRGKVVAESDDKRKFDNLVLSTDRGTWVVIVRDDGTSRYWPASGWRRQLKSEK